MRLRYGSPFWLDQTKGRAIRRYPQLRRELDVDVAIVGAGFTGCTAALIFAEAGLRVALLERLQVGRGSAAASTALLMQEPDRFFTSWWTATGWPQPGPSGDSAVVAFEI